MKISDVFMLLLKVLWYKVDFFNNPLFRMVVIYITTRSEDMNKRAC
jgi:hypothetical protein